jgi:transcriptional regulator with XRE-family HTH domain
MAKKTTTAAAPDTFGARLIALRTAKGFPTGADLARAIWGTTPDSRGFEVAKNRDTIWRYETDKSLPSKKNLELVAQALQVSLDDLDPDHVIRKRPQTDRPVAQQRALTTQPKLRNDMLGPNMRHLVIDVAGLPAEIADRAFAEISAWWDRTGGADRDDGDAAAPLPSPLGRKK